MKRKYQYRGRRNRRNRVLDKHLYTIWKIGKAVSILIAAQKARQAAMNLPEYASGGDSVDLPVIVGHDGLPEFISNPVK